MARKQVIHASCRSRSSGFPSSSRANPAVSEAYALDRRTLVASNPFSSNSITFLWATRFSPNIHPLPLNFPIHDVMASIPDGRANPTLSSMMASNSLAI